MVRVITAEREQSTVNHSKDKSIQCYKTSLFITCFTSDMHDYIIINYVGSSHYISSPLESEAIRRLSSSGWIPARNGSRGCWN